MDIGGAVKGYSPADDRVVPEMQRSASPEMERPISSRISSILDTIRADDREIARLQELLRERRAELARLRELSGQRPNG